MHLQQTKLGSRESGGPQYYFHDVPDPVKEFLHKRGACKVVLQTPYGIAASDFVAVGRDHKWLKGKAVPGAVGHDRIVAGGGKSIGEEIRYWYGLNQSGDFETITVEVPIHPDGHFILIPTAVKMRDKTRTQQLKKVHAPLSFNPDHQSTLWRQQIEAMRAKFPEDAVWAASQIDRVVAEHRKKDAAHILESDLLRTAGALSLLGVQLSAYLGKGYDCVDSHFQFAGYPLYPCPVEIKNRSRGFNYQVKQYTELPRVVVLCMDHDLPNPPDHVDIIELPTIAQYLGR